MKKSVPVPTNDRGRTAPAKKSWISPTLETQPARLASITGGGTTDGASCHS